MRTAIYARFSSDLQDARSIVDQVALAREYADRQDWQVISVFSDAAISGASLHNRPQLQELMRAAEARAFDVVLTESIDRLSRDLEDIAGIHKRLGFWGVKIVTLADGEVGTLHVGLRGIVASIFLADLAQKTRRGQIGRVRAGRIPGGRCYGYDVLKEGEERGRRAIDERKADVVRRIFAEYAAGVSPMAIVRALNAEGIAGPRGGPWNVSALLGSPQRRNGILNNEIYIGRLVYNRQKFVKDPRTGRRLARANPEDQWITAETPELAIVDLQVWQAVQDRRARLGKPHLFHRRRPKHIFSGLLQCGSCGANMIVKGSIRGVTYFACSVRINRGGCDNARTVPAPEIESRVLGGLKRLLLSPDAVEAAVSAYREERARLAREQAKARDSIERELAETTREIARVMDAIKLGGQLEPLVQSLQSLETRRKSLEAQAGPADDRVVTLHPQAAQRYRQIVEDLQSALTAGAPSSAKAIEIVRSLITRIRVIPAANRQPVGLEISGNLAALIADAAGVSREDLRERPGIPSMCAEFRV